MAYDETQKRISLDADASIGVYTGVPGMPGSAVPNGGKQYYFVDITGIHAAGLVASIGAIGIGVLQNKPQHVNDASTIAISGVSLLTVGVGGLVAGAGVASDATGKGITSSGTNAVLARVIIGANVGELATVLLQTN